MTKLLLTLTWFPEPQLLLTTPPLKVIVLLRALTPSNAVVASIEIAMPAQFVSWPSRTVFGAVTVLSQTPVSALVGGRPPTQLVLWSKLSALLALGIFAAWILCPVASATETAQTVRMTMFFGAAIF